MAQGAAESPLEWSEEIDWALLYNACAAHRGRLPFCGCSAVLHWTGHIRFIGPCGDWHCLDPWLSRPTCIHQENATFLFQSFCIHKAEKGTHKHPIIVLLCLFQKDAKGMPPLPFAAFAAYPDLHILLHLFECFHVLVIVPRITHKHTQKQLKQHKEPIVLMWQANKIHAIKMQET